ncbi:hypothetical protein D3C80_1794100 [compost metagenome]
MIPAFMAFTLIFKAVVSPLLSLSISHKMVLLPWLYLAKPKLGVINCSKFISSGRISCTLIIVALPAPLFFTFIRYSKVSLMVTDLDSEFLLIMRSAVSMAVGPPVVTIKAADMSDAQPSALNEITV